MTLQWTIVAGVLYAEIAATFILLLPWIRPTLWSKLFKSRLFTALSKHAQIYSMAFGFVLFILYFHSAVEAMKSKTIPDESKSWDFEEKLLCERSQVLADQHLHKSTMSLLFFLILQLIFTLKQRIAQLEAAGEAAMRQAENASKTARTLMNATETSEEVAELKKQIEKLKSELKSANTDRDNLKKQSEGLQNGLCQSFFKLPVFNNIKKHEKKD